MQWFMRAASAILATALLSGCAAHLPRTRPQPAVGAGAAAPPDSLSESMQKVRHLSAPPRPRSDADVLATLESRDQGLAADLRRIAATPSAALHRDIAERYRQRGVLDAAYRHFNQAIALNFRDAEAYEGLARVWRDWRLPHLALGDAHRAKYYAPRSASARNTYGTVMQALGHHAEARRAYTLASRLDPNAAYAVNNLCYLAFLEGRTGTAIETCQQALRLDPTLDAARNNLALAHAADGRLDLARQHLLDAGDRASGLYNTGIVYLATGDYGRALAAFDDAGRARPTFHLARERAEHLRGRLRIDPLSERHRDAHLR